MGQEITRFGDECNCFVGSEPDREPAQTPRTVDPVANLVTKEFPKTVLTPPPPTSTKSNQVYNVNPWMSAEEEEGFFVPPPPPPPDPEPYQASEDQEPPSAEKAPAPALPAPPAPAETAKTAKPKPASSPSAASAPTAATAPPRPAESTKPKAKARAEGASGAINFEAMLLDLEGAEEAAFTAAFKSLSDGRTALQPDHDQLRSFILVNSGIGEQDLDTELLKIASAREDFCIDIPGFIALLREHPVSDSDTLTLFMNVSNDGESMTSEDCRTCLLELVAKLPDAHIREDRMEKIFDTVMTSADLSISMEQWMAFAKTTARIIRLMAHAKTR